MEVCILTEDAQALGWGTA